MKEISTRQTTNKHQTREGWLRAATDLLRQYFSESGFEIPEKMRFSIGFPSTGRQGKRLGELWHGSTSNDETYELFIRADVDTPSEVLGILVHELLHAVLPIDAGHGKLYKDGAAKIGLTGPMRHAMPNALLTGKLETIAADLGPLPHARLNIERGRDNRGPADRPKKQKGRLLKATCPDESCGYNVRVVAKWVADIGPPHCPKHGAMTMDATPDDIEDAAEAESHDQPGQVAESV